MIKHKIKTKMNNCNVNVHKLKGRLNLQPFLRLAFHVKGRWKISERKH